MAVTTDNYIYSRLLKKAAIERIIPNRTQEAREWFRKKAQNYRGSRINQDKLFAGSLTVNTVMPGRMYMYVYDAKTKETLPYWDAFPLIFPVMTFPGGFYGLNMHYLQPVLRAKLMDALYTITNNTRYDDTTRLRISYETLKSASSMNLFKPCFKQYLYGHVKSQFIYVEPKEWDIALFLPLQNFQKASAAEVWRDSARQVQTQPTRTNKSKRKR